MPIAIYDAGSKIKGKIKSIYHQGNTANTWGFQIGCQEVDLEIDSLHLTNCEVGGSFWNPMDTLGPVQIFGNRDLDIRINKIQLGTGNSSGFFRYQPGNGVDADPGRDSMSTYKLQIGKFYSEANSAIFSGGFMIWPNRSMDLVDSCAFHFAIEEIQGQFFESLFACENEPTADTIRNSSILFQLGKYRGSGGDIYRSVIGSSTNPKFKGCDFRIQATDFEADSGGRILFSNNSFVESDIHLNVKVKTSNSLIDFSGLAIDSTSNITISGSIENNASSAVIDFASINANTYILLEDLKVKNDGTVAAIQSDIARTVYVRNCVDLNTKILDPDITFVSLDAY